MSLAYAPSIRHLTLRDGRSLTITPLVLLNGEQVDGHVDPVDGSVVIADPGDPDQLVANAFTAGVTVAILERGGNPGVVETNVTFLAKPPECPVLPEAARRFEI